MTSSEAATVADHWCNTISGRKFSYVDTDPDSIDLHDIAHALSLQCRYNGHIIHFFSVAQHSVYVSQVAADIYSSMATTKNTYNRDIERLIALWGLFHDASEAYMGDLVRPLKRMMPQYEAMEARLDTIIQTKFAGRPIPPLYHEIIKEADNRVLAAEVETLVPNLHADWSIPWSPAQIPGGIQLCAPRDAEDLFLACYEGLRHVG